MTENASVKDKAAESTQAGKEAASDLASTASEQVQNVAGEAQKQARDLVGEARGQVRSQVGDQHRNAVTNLRSLGDELNSMSENGQGGVATDLVTRAAGQAHGVADWLDGREPEDILEEVRRFARRRPGAFLLGALAAGIVAGRLGRGTVAAHKDNGDSSDSTVDSSVSARPTPGPGGYGDQTAYGSQTTYGSAAAVDPYAAPATQGLVDESARHAAAPDVSATPGYGYPSDGAR
ncbi:hypothetical protein [uncultured Jatrophihabitans sp.]|uniref:hypothetical protein n=1 Tax=uncultured Jatrophihabitans sp. TaxID=1610747 RepID=UPI0035CAB6BC